MSFTEKLCQNKIISPKDVEEIKNIAKNSEKTEDDVLLERGLVKPEELTKLKSKYLDVPIFEEPENFEVPERILSIIPEESAIFYKMVPLGLKDKVLEVGMINPDDIKSKEVLLFLTRQNKLELKVYTIDNDLFDKVIKSYKNINEEVGEALDALETELGSDEIKMFSEDEKPKLERLTEEAPIIKMVAVILRHAVEASASDIHIEPTQNNLRIRFRLDGILHSSLNLPIRTHPSIVARIKIVSRLRIDENRIPQDGRFTARIDKKEVDFRVSVLPTKLGEKVVIRVLDPNEGLKNYKEIGMSDNNIAILRSAIVKPFGLILSTGPTGSGKTTTLYSILQELNKPEVNIITLEDPIEYFVGGVNQSQIRPEIGYGFSQGLRSVVRQDPDIIMVGEIRDDESASLVTHAALTGHIVLSTIHTNNATGVISRLIDMKIRQFLIPATLNIAIAQRLARRICPYCMEKVSVNKEIEKMILKSLSDLPPNVKQTLKIPNPLYIYKSKGCKKCNFKGEKGRVGIFEILRMTKELEEIIISNPTEAALQAEAKRQGMITMRQDAIIKAMEGKISLEEVLRTTE